VTTSGVGIDELEFSVYRARVVLLLGSSVMDATELCCLRLD
jgi:hypothetical protein